MSSSPSWPFPSVTVWSLLVIVSRVLQGQGAPEVKDVCNVALGKPSSQTSLCCGGFSWNAVDGDRSSEYHDNSCAHTMYPVDNWWKVDLQTSYPVVSIAITNRNGGERLSNFGVYVSDIDPQQQIPLPNGSFIGDRCFFYTGAFPLDGPHTIQCDEPVTGRYVYLYKSGDGELVFCEFEVMTPVVSHFDFGPKSFDFWAGRKATGLTPFYVTTIDPPSMLKCAGVCLAKGCESTVMQFEEGTGRCECLQKTPVDEEVQFESDPDWVLMVVSE